MKKRSIWKMFLLEIVTLGIYRLYWLIKTRNEMIATKPSIKIKSPWFLLVPIILIIAAVAVMIGSLVATAPSKLPNCSTTNTSINGYNYNRIDDIYCRDKSTNKRNLVGAVAGLTLPLAIVVAYIIYIIWLWDYCHGVEIVTKGKTSFAISLVILILVPDGIDILIIQDGFNNIARRHSASTA